MRPLGPWIVLLRGRAVSADDVASVWRIWGDDPVDIRGEPLSLDLSKPSLRARLPGGERYGEQFIIPQRRRDGVSHQIAFNPEGLIHVDSEEGLTIDVPWLMARRQKAVLVVQANPQFGGAVHETRNMMEFARRVARLVDAEFALGDDPTKLADPTSPTRGAGHGRSLTTAPHW